MVAFRKFRRLTPDPFVFVGEASVGMASPSIYGGNGKLIAVPRPLIGKSPTTVLVPV
jgi:hypothetical protein